MARHVKRERAAYSLNRHVPKWLTKLAFGYERREYRLSIAWVFVEKRRPEVLDVELAPAPTIDYDALERRQRGGA